MPEFMDVHTSMQGVTSEALKEAHDADLAIQAEEGVNFKQAWADPTSGMVFAFPRLQTLRPFSGYTRELDTRPTTSTRCQSRPDFAPTHQASLVSRGLRLGVPRA
jgi:hypothetical protein